jgi:hypothetical protein
MRSVRHLVLITLVSATSVWGCEDAKPVTATPSDGGATGGSTGAGGAATGGSAAGGSTGAGGTTGADAGTPPGSTCTIPCIVALTQDCVPSGTCMEQSNGLTGNNRCYSNGVKVATALAILPAPALTLTTKKPAGGVCYTVVGSLTSATSTSGTLVLKNAAGQQVGTGTYDLTTNQATVSCDNATFDAAAVATCASVLSLPSLPTGNNAPTSGCTAGACTP